jgi:hypothetical protein
MADALLIKTLVVILASVCAISLVARIRLPAAGGYLLAGLVIGPHGLHLIAKARTSTKSPRLRGHPMRFRRQRRTCYFSRTGLAPSSCRIARGVAVQ